MKPREPEAPILRKKGGELFLSGTALTNLLRAVLEKEVPFRFRAKGFSMSPFIKDGDVITVFPLRSVSAYLGDILAFIHPGTGKLVVHRMVGKRGTSYLIKGDSTSDADDLVPKGNILGSVKSVERGGKRVSLGLGPEKFLIAFLTRRKLLFPLLYLVRRLVRSIIKKGAT